MEDPRVPREDGNPFVWPKIDGEAESNVIKLLRTPGLADSSNVEMLEREMASWLGRAFAVATSSGTAALEAAMFAVGVRPGDEIIGPTLAYWACVQPATRLGATIVLVDVEPETLTIDPEKVEAAITPATRAVVAVHMYSRLADMDRLRAVCAARHIHLIEDASLTVGALCDGRRAGALAEVSAFSLNGKVFAASEGGMAVTDDPILRSRLIAWGLHHRTTLDAADKTVAPYAGSSIGATTSRISNVTAVLARAQLAAMDRRIADIDASMTIFADKLDALPGLTVSRPRSNARVNAGMGAWHQPLAFLAGADADGLDQIAARLQAQDIPATTLRAVRRPLHSYPWFCDGPVDPSLAPFKPRIRALGPFPVADAAAAIVLPRFTSFNLQAIDLCVAAFADALRDASGSCVARPRRRTHA